jgi:sn-glycerol 3-phosphate transport system permease protein
MEAVTAAAAAEKVALKVRKSLLAHLTPYLLIAPTFVLVFLFTLKPTLGALIDSTYRPARLAQDPPVFVGLENYANLFDPSHHIGARFGQIVGNTILFAVGTVAVVVPLALTFALLLNRRLRLLGFWRFSFVYPSLLPLIGAASIWAFIFADQVGLAAAILRALRLPGVNWLGDPDIVLWAVIVVNIWSQTGYYMLFYLAGLQSIPRDLYEAADLDGASYRQQLVYLTLPLLRRTTLFILTISFTFAFQTVDQLQALTEGGPGDRSNLLLYFIFQNIGERRNWGYINAMTILLAGIVLVFTITNFLFFERGGRENER